MKNLKWLNTSCRSSRSNCSINMYADDTVLYFTSLCSPEIKKVVQDDLNRVAKWIECNKLILNHSKTKTMLFGSRQNLAKSPNFCIQLHGKILEKVRKFSYLGVFLDETLSWKDHVEYVSSKVSSRLGLLSRIRACLTRWKLLNKYITHSCSHYLTMLMLLGVKSQKDVAKSSSVYKIMQLELYFVEKLQKMLFTC